MKAHRARMADLRKRAGETGRLAKLAEDSAAGQVADGLARPQEQAKGDIASADGAASGGRQGQVGKAVAEDMEILERDVFGEGSVFDPHHVQPLGTFGPETKKRPPYDPELLGAMLDQYCAGYACKPKKEKNTNVPLAPVSAILYGKIYGRILSAGRLVQRDAYDLAVACLVDKGAVEETLELIPAENKESILMRIRDARRGRAANDRTLMVPKYPELAKDPWGALAEVLRDTFGCE